MGIYKIWIAGSGTLVITIDHHTKVALGLKEGDYLEIPVLKKVEIKEEKEEEMDSELEKKKARFK